MTQLSPKLNITQKSPLSFSPIMTSIMRSWFAGWTKTFNCDFVFYIPRRWKEVGEQSTLWTNLNLGFYVYKEGRGKEGWEVDEEGARVRIVDGEEVCDSVDICGWTEQLMELLTMPRLQCLEHLELIFFFMGEIFWEDCMLFLQLVSDFAPSVKRLSWIG